MAAVANCPQCEHELLIPDGADTGAWAKCPACRAFFQLRDAVPREVPQLVLLDDTSPTPPIDPTNELSLPADESLELGADSLFGEDTVVGTDLSDSDTVVTPTGPSVDDILERYKRDLDRFATGLAGASNASEDERPDPQQGQNIEAPSAISDKPSYAAESDPTQENNFVGDDSGKSFRSADTVADLPALPPNNPMGVSDTEFIPRKASPEDAERSSAEIELSPSGDVDGQRSEIADESTFGADWSAPFTGELSATDESLSDNRDAEGQVSDEESLREPSRSTFPADDGAMGEYSADPLDGAEANADFEIETAEIDEDRPTWDDPDRMERLLADVEAPANEDWREVPDLSEEDAPNQVAVDEATDHEVPSPAIVKGGNTDHEYAEQSLPPIIAGSGGDRRRGSPVVLLAGTVIGAGFGLALGYYALLWISSLRGLDSDFLDVARFLPSAMVPESLRPSPPHVAIDKGEANLGNSLLDGVETSTAASPTMDDEAGEVTASYDAPVTPVPSDESLGTEDRYSSTDAPTEPASVEPLDFEAPGAAPITEAPDVVAIADGPTYTVGQVTAGLDDARQAQPTLVSGNLTDPSTHRPKGRSYAKLSQLAELVTFGDQEASDSDMQSVKDDAIALFRETLAEPRIRSEVGYIASKWIDSRGRDVNGIFFAGEVSNRSAEGILVELQIDSGVGHPIAVVAPASAYERVDDLARPVAVVGSIIDNPSERISGYTGTAPRVIWAAKLIPLD